MKKIKEIQEKLKREGLSGWLFYDFHKRNPLPYSILKIPTDLMFTRRWFYFVPFEGVPVKIVHPVEKNKLDLLEGEKIVYFGWKNLQEILKKVLPKKGKVAMDYSPNCNVPYVSYVDAGTFELLKSIGLKIVSSQNLIQYFEARISKKGYAFHKQAQRKIDKILKETFNLIKQNLGKIKEFEAQKFILKRFEEENLTCEGDPPIVGVLDHPADPHFSPTEENSYVIEKDQTLLIDLWAKVKDEEGIYYDITWCGFTGKNPPEKYIEIFNIVLKARDSAIEFIKKRFKEGKKVYGYEVDDVSRKVVEKAGYGKYFVHRTGHSIGKNVHGNGVNIDNLETKDERVLEKGLLFSIEPGIYLEGEMAVRTEVDVFINYEGEVEITGKVQNRLVLL
ncbi:MAG: M24 family metallopeptidase [Thermoanaerobaculia bacterium]